MSAWRSLATWLLLAAALPLVTSQGGLNVTVSSECATLARQTACLTFRLDSCALQVEFDLQLNNQTLLSFNLSNPNGQQQCSQQGPCSTCVELNSVVIEPTYAAGCAYVIQQCSLIPTRAKLGCFSLGTRCDMADCLSCAAADCGWCPSSGMCMAISPLNSSAPYCAEQCTGFHSNVRRCPGYVDPSERSASGGMSSGAKIGVIVACVVGSLIVAVLAVLLARRRRAAASRSSDSAGRGSIRPSEVHFGELSTHSQSDAEDGYTAMTYAPPPNVAQSAATTN